MAELLKGKVAIVSGGVTGIGRAITQEYIRQGARVMVNFFPDDSSKGHFASLKQECVDAGYTDCLHGIAGDISLQETSRTLVQETVDKFGKLDVLVSNAGVCQFAEFLELEKSLFDSTIATNLSGAFYLTQASARQMVRQGTGGSIVGIASISALVGGGGQTHYTPSKAGVLSLMQSCAIALGRHGVRCNALLPGTIRTQMNEADLSDEEKRVRMESRTCLGRLGRPADLAGPAVFLASDMAGYVTGAQLLVDGGMFVNLQ